MAEQSQLFSNCSSIHGEDTNAVLLCITEGLEEKYQGSVDNTASWLLLLAGAFVFIMQLGFAMLSAGCVRRKNISNTLLKNLLDASFTAIAWFSVGFAFAFGGQNAAQGTTFIGTENFFLTSYDNYAFWFYEYSCSATAVTIIAGTLAERCKMSAYIAYCLAMASFCYPILAHSIWSENGFLSTTAKEPFLGIGMIDFAGSGVIHVTGGATALIAAYILGPRKGRFYDLLGMPLPKPKDIPGHSIALQTMGILTLWFGWFGFNAGGALILPQFAGTPPLQGNIAGLTAVNTAMAGGAAAVSALLTNMWLSGPLSEMSFDLTKTLNGVVTGLVAITAGCGVLEPWAAVLVGVIAGWIYLGASKLMIRLRIDDAVDGIPVHLFGGMWGVLSTGLLASPRHVQTAYNSTHAGFFYSLGNATFDASLLASEVVGLLSILVWVSLCMVPCFWLLSRFSLLRIEMLEEIAGLDACYQVAKEEDNEQLREQVQQEFQQFKKDRERAIKKASSSDGQTITSAGSHGTNRMWRRGLTSLLEEDLKSMSASMISTPSTSGPPHTGMMADDNSIVSGQV